MEIKEHVKCCVTDRKNNKSGWQDLEVSITKARYGTMLWLESSTAVISVPLERIEWLWRKTRI